MSNEAHAPHRRNTDTQLLEKWGYDSHAPAEILEMAKQSHFLGTLRAGQAIVHLGYADTTTVENYLRDKPNGTPLLEYLAQKIEGIRPEIQRILALQDGMPYYRQLGPAHPSLGNHTVMQACAKLESTLITTPTGDPCIVFVDHDAARRYGSMGRQEQSADAIRINIGRTPIIAVGARNAVTSRLNLEYAQSNELEQIHITPASANTEVQKRLIQIFDEAIHRGASNIAIQPDSSGMTMIRLRVRGAMVPINNSPMIAPDIATEIANTLHAWSNATYTAANDRVQGQLQGPAGGQFTYRSTESETFFRASFTLPDSLGGAILESISLRLLPRGQLRIRLQDLRIKQNVIDMLDDAMHEQRGIVLLVGSTSSGKSTTVHGTLDLYREIHGDTKNCLSLENPVERHAPGLVSHSITKDCGFALMMAEILRQDPDLIFIGEMRDRSSTSTGIRAANSGHIVIGTIHSNDSLLAVGAIRGYISNPTVDNGAEVMVTDFDMVHSINLIVAQQLVPELCPHCRQPTSAEDQRIFGARIIRYAEKHNFIPAATEKNGTARTTLLRNIANAIKSSNRANPTGCDLCENTGYTKIGNLPINEVFAPDAHCKQLMIDMLTNNRLNLERLRPYRQQTLFDAALERVRDGETPMDALYV